MQISQFTVSSFAELIARQGHVITDGSAQASKLLLEGKQARVMGVFVDSALFGALNTVLFRPAFNFQKGMWVCVEWV